MKFKHLFYQYLFHLHSFIEKELYVFGSSHNVTTPGKVYTVEIVVFPYNLKAMTYLYY